MKGSVNYKVVPPIKDIITEIENEVNAPIYKTLGKAENFIINTKELRDMLYRHYLKKQQPQKARAVKECGTFLMFKQYKDAKATAQLASANFCKNPLCPMCAWRKHIKNSNIMSYAMEEIGGKVSHLVLAVPNTKYITRERLLNLKERAVSFIKGQLGCENYYTSLEIVASDAGFHPHMHILLETEKYFQVSEEFIKDFSQRWKKHFDKKDNEIYNRAYDGYTFFVRGITGDYQGALQEVTKYVVKAETKIDTAYTEQLADAVFGVRKTSAGGSFKKAIKAGKVDALIETEKFFRELSAYEWEYQIYNFINGRYIKK
jgi:plasmid rolling circle replication initiator protein Rep